jgi:(p)ppGpp synthase/HD superfamily hydrolase
MELTSRFSDALLLAFEIHREQTKKSTDIPYISHLLEVAGLVLSYGGNQDEAIAALLHDSIEDHPEDPRVKTIGERFGGHVLAIVESCSDSNVIPKPPWRGRKEKYIEHLREAEESVLMVAAADKLVNARTIIKDLRQMGDEVWQRFNAGQADQLWYYRTVTQTLIGAAGNGRARALAEELQRAVNQLEEVSTEYSKGG